MKELKLQIRYAQSLFDLAKQTDILESVYNDVLSIRDICLENHELQVILKNPIIKPLLKRQIILSLFENNCQELTIKFLSFVVTKRREIHLLGICESFIDIYRKDKSIQSVELVVSESISDSLREEIVSHLKDALKTDVWLTIKVNPKLIGGFCLTIDGKQYDASFLKKLSILRKDFAAKL